MCIPFLKLKTTPCSLIHFSLFFTTRLEIDKLKREERVHIKTLVRRGSQGPALGRDTRSGFARLAGLWAGMQRLGRDDLGSGLRPDRAYVRLFFVVVPCRRAA
jgi:hypothetical protein